MGSTSNKIKDAVLNNENYDNSLPIFQVSNMEMAVKKAKEVAKNKDYVLFSPACASFDLYKNFGKEVKISLIWFKTASIGGKNEIIRKFIRFMQN